MTATTKMKLAFKIDPEGAIFFYTEDDNGREILLRSFRLRDQINRDSTPFHGSFTFCIHTPASTPDGGDHEQSVSGWRRIETAPHDGTFVLTCVDPWRPAVMHWATYEGVTRWGEDPETFMARDHFVEYWCQTSYDPTHWMPLPAPPEDY